MVLRKISWASEGEQDYYINENNKRGKMIEVENCIVITGSVPNEGRLRYGWVCDQFVHIMEYFYYASDIIVNTKSFVILIEPPGNWHSRYVTDYIKMMYEKFDNFIFTTEFKFNNELFINQYDINLLDKIKPYLFDHNKYKIIDKYKIYKDENFIEKKDEYYNWFPNQNSNLIRDLFIKEKINKDEIKIGLVNREHKSGRFLENYKELCGKIYEKFGIQVCVTYFEDKTFEEQINFFNKHDIIISPHGAQLCSIPFLEDEGLIIECVHEEWHPYYYFSGLTYTSNKYHAVICDDHSVFPERRSARFRHQDQKKLNIITNIDKIIKVIDMYINKNLVKKYSYLL